MRRQVNFCDQNATGLHHVRELSDRSREIIEVLERSLWVAASGTVIMLLIAYPIAYFIARRVPPADPSGSGGTE